MRDQGRRLPRRVRKLVESFVAREPGRHRLGAPHEVQGFDKADYGLLEVRVAEWGHLVFATLDPEAMSLGEWLGDLPTRLAGYRLEDMAVVAERDYDVAANWKLVAENFMEYYHLPRVHPELAKVSRVEDHHRFQGPGLYTGNRRADSAGVADPAYPGGRMCYRFEEPLHRFQNMIIDRMVGRQRVPAGDGDASPYADLHRAAG